MEDQINPTQGASDSPSAASSGAVDMMLNEAKAEAGIDAFAAQLVGAVPQNEEPVEAEESESEDAEVEVEELTEDDADDETPVEAEAEDDQDESDQDEDVELDVVSFDDLKGYALEIGGDTYTAAQLKSMIGRMKSAGKEAREADQKIKDADDRLAKVAQAEEYAQNQLVAAKAKGQLASLQNAAQAINKKIATARDAGDMYEVAVQRENLEILKQQATTINTNIKEAEGKAHETKTALARDGLIKRGLSHLNNDGKETKAWAVSYTHLTLPTILLV